MSTLIRADYLAMQSRLQVIAQLAADTDPETIEAFIRQAEHADTLGPFMDPTAWSAGHDRLATVIRHARALAAFRREVTA
jgi:hypothetical protein